MPRIQFDDVTPPGKRSIRNIPIPSGGKRKISVSIKPEISKKPSVKSESVFVRPVTDAAQSAPQTQNHSDFESKMSQITERKESGPYEYYYPKNETKGNWTGGNSRSNKKYLFGGLTIAAILVFVVGMMTVFSSATLSIVPKSQEINVDSKIIASTNNIATSSVRYEVIKLTDSKTISVPASGEEMAEIKASGKIIIYNNYSTESQRLIVRTRFESPEGLIYRIPESVIIPGKTIKDGVSTPGSVEIEVFADEAGDKYNIKKTDFTIPGFKTDAERFKNFYARSITPMTGGFVGKRKTISQSDKQTALNQIDAELQEKLKKQLETKIPDGLALIPGSIVYGSKELILNDDSSNVSVGKEMTAYALMFNITDLSSKLIKEYIGDSTDWKDIKSTVNNFSNLLVSDIPSDFETKEKIDLKIKGKMTVLADINTNAISQRLIGAPKKDAGKLIDEYAGISSVTATIRPIWKQSFPENQSKIYVKITPNQ